MTYTTSQVAHVALVTPRQLQWWDEEGILSPVQSERKRRYEPRELFAVMLFRELRERKFSMKVVRRVWKLMQKQRFDMPCEGKKYLLTNGERVVFLEQDNVVLAFLLQRRSPPYYLISLVDVQERMNEQLAIVARRGPVSARVSQPVTSPQERAG